MITIKNLSVTDIRKLNEPKGFYASAVPALDQDYVGLVSFAQRYGLPNSGLIKDPHITVMYSSTLPKEPKLQYSIYGNTVVDHFEYWEGHDKAGYVVAKLNSEPLKTIHQELKQLGCTHSFEEYSAHITLHDSIGVANVQLLDNINRANRDLKKYSGINILSINLSYLVYDDLR